MSAKVNPDGDERDLQNRFYVRICAPEELEVICRSKHKSSVLAQLTSEGLYATLPYFNQIIHSQHKQDSLEERTKSIENLN